MANKYCSSTRMPFVSPPVGVPDDLGGAYLQLSLEAERLVEHFSRHYENIQRWGSALSLC